MAYKKESVKLDKGDLKYCIDNIKSGNLYEVNVKALEEKALDMESLNWIRSYSSTRLGRRQSVARNEIRSKLELLSTFDRFGLSDQAKHCLTKVDKYDFDIFEFREAVNNQELSILSSFLMDKH